MPNISPTCRPSGGCTGIICSRGRTGARHVCIDCLNDLDGIVAWEGEDYFALILRAYLALGRHRAGRVGKAQSELIDAADIVAFGARWMEENLESRKRGTVPLLGTVPLFHPRQRRPSQSVRGVARSTMPAPGNARDDARHR